MNPKAPAIRYRMRFSKTEHMRFTGHLDLNRTLERTFRRANLPISYTHGFTRRVKFNIASALPLGYTSDCEVSDVWLDEEVPKATFIREFRGAAPPGIDLQSIGTVPVYDPSLQSQLESSEYEVTLLEEVPELDEKLEQFLAAETLLRSFRKKKEYDLRPLILKAVRMDSDAEGRAKIYLQLVSREGAMGRVSEVLTALEVNPHAVRVKRTALNFV